MRQQSGQAKIQIQLSILGPFEISRSGGPELRLPKKTQGLLGYLALQKGKSVPRDQLATLLWGNSASEQARQSLRQCLAALRNSLGHDSGEAIVADQSVVSLSTVDNWHHDVAAFEDGLASDDVAQLQAASELYRGELLSGLHIAVEPFNDWLTVERQRLRDLYLTLHRKLAIAQLARGDHAGAVKAARTIVHSDAFGEDGHRLLMRLLVLNGDRPAALKQFDACAKILREELDLAPDRETTELADAIRRGGPIQVGGGETTKQQQEPPATASEPSRSLPEQPSIGILPFANLTGDAEQDRFVDGLVDDITVALGRERWLFVVASASAFAFRDRSIDPRQAASTLGVRYVVRGSVRRDANRIRMVVQLLDGFSGNQMWSDVFEDQIDNVFALHDRLASKLAAMIAPALRHAEIERSVRKTATNLTAYDLYLRAIPKYRVSLEANLEALSYLKRAIAIDPDYASAYGLVARCFHVQRYMGWVPVDDPSLAEGVHSARRAAEVGGQDSESLWMASLALAQVGDDLTGALGLVERSLLLNPNSSNAWSASCMVRSNLCDFERAFSDFERSQRLNPLDVSHHLHWNIVGLAHLFSGNYHDANAAADKTLVVRSDYPPALRMKLTSCGHLGLRDEAASALSRLRAVHPDYSVDWTRRYWRFLPDRIIRILVEGARLAGA